MIFLIYSNSDSGQKVRRFTTLDEALHEQSELFLQHHERNESFHSDVYEAEPIATMDYKET